MSATIPREDVLASENEPPLAADRAEDGLRDAAIASLKRKRKFAQDAIGYVAVNGVLWLIWALSVGRTVGGVPWPAWVSLIWGFLLAIDAWQAFGRWPASLHRPITEDEIRREMKRGN